MATTTEERWRYEDGHAEFDAVTEHKKRSFVDYNRSFARLVTDHGRLHLHTSHRLHLVNMPFLRASSPIGEPGNALFINRRPSDEDDEKGGTVVARGWEYNVLPSPCTRWAGRFPSSGAGSGSVPKYKPVE